MDKIYDDDEDTYIEIIKQYRTKTNKDNTIEILEHENNKLKEELQFMENANQKLANIIIELRNNKI
jgi:hypothetical protein